MMHVHPCPKKIAMISIKVDEKSKFPDVEKSEIPHVEKSEIPDVEKSEIPDVEKSDS